MRRQTAALTAAPADHWTPPFTLEERLKYALVPGPLYIRYRAAKEWWRGEREVRLLPHLVDPNRVSIDVGANKGVYTYFLARRSRRVFAFEPNPKIFAVLRRNLRTTAAAVLSPLALSDRAGTAVLRVPKQGRGYSNQGSSLSAVKVRGDYREVAVQTARLDDLAIADVGFMKIDVEGFESEVLRGARATIARDRPVLLIEMEERHRNQPIEAAIAEVEALGYRGLVLHRGRLLDLTRFDPERMHRSPATREDYINNFIFLPGAVGERRPGAG
jgi:FkbM family methyltransferase